MPAFVSTGVSAAQLRSIQRRRKLVLLVGVMFGFAVAASTASYWTDRSFLRALIHSAGLLLIVVCIVGRTWCALYIGGLKQRELIVKGPYSVVRNPLYLFAVLGTAGIGTLSGSIVLGLLFAAFAAAVFVFVVRREEIFLNAAFPATYPAYAARVPRFWPRFSVWEDADELAIKPAVVRRTLRDTCWFLLAVPVMACIGVAQANGWFIALWRLP